MGIEAQLVSPIRQCRERVLPEANLGSAGVIQVVVVAGEALLCSVRDIDHIMPRAGRPEDVVLEEHVLAAAGHLQCIGVQLHRRVVEQVHGPAGRLGIVQLNASA